MEGEAQPMATTTLERPPRKVDTAVEAITDEGLPEPATASETDPAAKTKELATVARPRDVEHATTPRLTSQQVWADRQGLIRDRPPRLTRRRAASRGMNAEERHHLYVAVAPGGWKARQITDDPAGRPGDDPGAPGRPPVAVDAHPSGDDQLPRAGDRAPGRLARSRERISNKLLSLLPKDRRAATVLELVPRRS